MKIGLQAGILESYFRTKADVSRMRAPGTPKARAPEVAEERFFALTLGDFKGY
jgi:hypothetical protein